MKEAQRGVRRRANLQGVLAGTVVLLTTMALIALVSWAVSVGLGEEAPDGEPDYSSPADLAISISWPLYEDGTKIDPRARTGVKKSDAESTAVLDSYREARALAVQRQIWDGDPKGLLRNDEYFGRCSTFIATIVIDTITPNFAVPSLRMYPLMSDPSNGWVLVGTSETYDPSSYKPGDIFVTRGHGHTFMWIGNYGGYDDVIAEAGLDSAEKTWVGALRRYYMNPDTGLDGADRAYDVYRYEGIPIAPEAPIRVSAEKCGQQAVVAIPSMDHVTYVKSESDAQVRVTAVADDLYRIADGAQWEWVFDVTAEPCP